MKRLLMALTMTAALASPAAAATITFDGIPASNSSVTGLFTEAGFNLAVTGLYAGSEAGGTELEPLCCASTGNLTVTAIGGGLFEFGSVGIQHEYGTQSFLRVEGFRLGISQGVDIFLTSTMSYINVGAANLAGLDLDALVITGERANDGISFDNLVVGAVASTPEPATMLLFGTALAGLVTSRRRARRS